ncbi:hypothetical protein STSP2_01964 [Anaerohalosphaera lusitana]|uniref:Uncharacterized protein n=1 Tax=Anaerohalosphaera lusitana TaxID=1936003 RepID=A0A1U9NLI3_9BACT|nr:hypothetical protein [Anaerohalosphaera lusitana]AQT68791.1 hypothetical protein STSP2_01964 [Anaerohalosphaera lusitana]
MDNQNKLTSAGRVFFDSGLNDPETFMSNILKKNFVFIFVSLFLILAQEKSAADAGDPAESLQQKYSADASDDCNEKLLKTAFDVASKIPVDPHIKDRSKAQQKVVGTCLLLDRPHLAVKFIEGIKNWRQGLCYAEMGLYYAKRHNELKAKKWLGMADMVANEVEDWRKNRINIKVAQIYSWLGKAGEADRIESTLEAGEKGLIESGTITSNPNKTIEEQMHELDEHIATGNFDAVKNSLFAYANIYREKYADTDIRSKVEEKIKFSWKPIPVFIRIELLCELAEAAVDNEDEQKAMDLLKEIQQLLDAYDWPVRHLIPMGARTALLRAKAGNNANAVSKADTLLKLYEDKESSIVDIYKAETLIPLAEAYHSMGQDGRSLSVYRKALLAAFENPNSRPRAEDLSAICCSMALNGIELDKELWGLIFELSNELGQPW